MMLMNRTHRLTAVFILVTLLSLFFALPSASAANATEVWVNDVRLDASAYYLANGSSTATTTKPATGGYVYFNAAAGTLTLYNAQLNTTHFQSYNSLLFANGDLTVVLAGTSTLQNTATSAGTYMGIYVQGLLTLTGSGSATIQMNCTSVSIALYGIYSHDMKIEGGTLNVDIDGLDAVYGIDSYYDIYISGGNITIDADGYYGIGVYAQTGDFRMTGGSIYVTGSSDYDMYSVSGQNISLEGGTGTFWLGETSNGYGGVIESNTFSVSGGHFIFSGGRSALYSQTSSYTLNVSNVLTYASTNSSGSGKSLWSSPADGKLIATASNDFRFHYVEFIAYGTAPQTGDGQTPWLWAGIGMICLLSAAGFTAGARRKCR